MLLPKNALSLIRRFIAIDPRRDRAIDVALRESIDLRFARIAYVNGKADNERKRRVDEQEVIELLDVPPPADAAVDGLSLLSILLPRSECQSEPAEYTGFNSVILSKSPNAKSSSVDVPRGMSASLSSTQIGDNIVTAHYNLIDVLR